MKANGESKVGAGSIALSSVVKTPTTDTVKLETVKKDEKKKEKVFDISAPEACNEHELNKTDSEPAKSLITLEDTKVVGKYNINEQALPPIQSKAKVRIYMAQHDRTSPMTYQFYTRSIQFCRRKTVKKKVI